MPMVSLVYRTARAAERNFVSSKTKQQNKRKPLLRKDSFRFTCRQVWVGYVHLLVIDVGGPSPLWPVLHWEGHPGLWRKQAVEAMRTKSISSILHGCALALASRFLPCVSILTSLNDRLWSRRESQLNLLFPQFCSQCLYHNCRNQT